MAFKRLGFAILILGIGFANTAQAKNADRSNRNWNEPQ